MSAFKEFFYISRRERIGVAAIVVVSFIILLMPSIYRKYKPIQSWDFEILAIKMYPKEVKQLPNYEYLSKPKLFDPNIAGTDVFLNLGLSEKQANTIINYRNNGGVFIEKKDLRRIYGLSQEEYDRIEPYIEISNDLKNTKSEKGQYENAISAMNRNRKQKNKVIINIPTKPFDPNTVSNERLLTMGLPIKISNTIQNFRDRGGKFHHKSDLKMIYGMKEEWYEKLAPHIEIATKEKTKTWASHPTPKSYEKTSNKSKFKEIKIDINKASIEEWQALYGIGPSYAKKIVKFRNKLGGFASVQQVQETYGIPDSTKQKIAPFLVFSPIFNKIDLNKLPADSLVQHPYINWKKANIIVKYRNNHGPYKDFKDLQKVRALNEEFLQRIEPYLTY